MCVLARPSRPIGDLADADISAMGVYAVRLLDDVAPERLAQTVLASFHETCAFSDANDFDFHVFDPDSHIVLLTARGNGVQAQVVQAEVEKIHFEVPHVFACSTLSGESIVADTDIEAHQLERMEYARRARLEAYAPTAQPRPRG